MNSIFNIQQARKIAFNLYKQGQGITLVGGCFDILHIGHIKFLNSAKKLSEVLFILLESDEKVKKLKGINRPIFNQKDRAFALSNLKAVDYVVMLKAEMDDRDYEDLVVNIKPKIIAATENDPIMGKKRVQAKLVGAKLKVIPFIKTYSSSKLAKILEID